MSSPSITLKDVLFLCHAKPKDLEQAEVWKRLIAGKLKTPDTWETELSGGADKKETFTRLMQEDKLGGLAFLRNLRNMRDSDVDPELVGAYAQRVNISRVLPFRFIGAARVVPAWSHLIEPAMLRSCVDRPKLMGHTHILVDVSGSMDDKLSDKSDMLRLDAAVGVAIICRELCQSVSITTFSSRIVGVNNELQGFGLGRAISTSQSHQGTYLGAAMTKINENPGHRLIVITDEQSRDAVPAPAFEHAYLVNVANNKNGVSYKDNWKHIDGWSDAIIDYIIAMEDQA